MVEALEKLAEGLIKGTQITRLKHVEETVSELVGLFDIHVLGGYSADRDRAYETERTQDLVCFEGVAVYPKLTRMLEETGDAEKFAYALRDSILNAGKNYQFVKARAASAYKLALPENIVPGVREAKSPAFGTLINICAQDATRVSEAFKDVYRVMVDMVQSATKSG